MATLEDHAHVLVAHHYDMWGNMSPCLIFFFYRKAWLLVWSHVLCNFPWFSYFANFFSCIFFQYALWLFQPVRTRDKTCLQDYFLNHFILRCTEKCQYNCCQSNVVTCLELLGEKRDKNWENTAEGIKALEEPNTTMKQLLNPCLFWKLNIGECIA